MHSTSLPIIHPFVQKEKRKHQGSFLKNKYIFQKNNYQELIYGHICIQSVVSKKDFQRFRVIPKIIYQNDKNWIAPLWNDEKNFFKTRNHFWSHADAALFIAFVDGKPVGRIAGIIDELYMSHNNNKSGFFGFYESINDESVAHHLFSTVEAWLKSKHCTNITGPVNGRVDNGAGFLYHMNSSHPTILDSYSPSYYLDLVKNSGFKKERDLLTFSIDLKKPISQDLAESADKMKKDHHILLRRFNRWKAGSELKWWIPFFLETFSSHWGYIPVDFKEVRQRYGLRNIRWIGDADLFIIAETDQGPVGYLWGTPDYNQVFKKIDGNINPISAIKNIKTLKTIDYGKLNVIGVRNDYQNKQLALLLNYEVLKRMQQRGYKGADIGWIDERNTKALKVIEKMGATHHKTFRVFEKKIDLSR